ncbi:Cyclic AMP-dependent transcription factor ATF-6 alpha [Larimichthys crocea]|uniref:Uncharacterized protein n=1 Tax=Larimichthys crocea TaxID=215358 RepID=A0ACD3RKP3_LARCR|nr:Cyclic AMP-dependent transcription factor ATF-6 alpha [Larimichthys crocea]
MIRKLLLHNMFIRAIKDTAVISVVAKLKFCFSLLVTFRKKGLLFFPIQDEALSPQSQLSPVSVCSESSGISVISPPAKRAPKRTSQAARAKQAAPVKRPIQIGPKVSIQPKPVITAVPLAHAAAPLQAKTIIIQPLQTTVLPMVKPAPVNIQPAPPPGHPIVLSQPSQVLQIQAPQDCHQQCGLHGNAQTGQARPRCCSSGGLSHTPKPFVRR